MAATSYTVARQGWQVDNIGVAYTDIWRNTESLSFLERLSSLRRLKCTSIIDLGQSVAFIERFFRLCLSV